jgi:hypothetical protein
MAVNRIHGRWVVFMQALGLAAAYAISVGLLAGAVSVVAWALTGGRLG